MKNINWKNIAVTLALGVVAAVFVAPLVRPLLQKIPVIGKYA